MQKSWHCHTLSELPEIARAMLTDYGLKKIAFYGEIGSGKTHIISALCKELLGDVYTNSPTFTILNEYKKDNILVYHFDFFRLENLKELYEIGYEEYFYSDHFIFIEWAEKIEELLPDFFHKIEIKVLENEERIFILNI